jgi:cytochrome c biogenesis protein CcdA
MADSYIVDIGMALWLGILTSVSPCPLATNITAITYISRNINTKGYVLLSGMFYTLGRMLTYVIVGSVVVSASHAIPAISLFLQKHMNMVLGPVLILIGIFLLHIIKFNFKGGLISLETQKRLAGLGLLGALLIGAIFALSFCPVSAALFFGSTIGLAVKHASRFSFPSIYGAGTALPVVLFSIVLAFSAGAVSNLFNKVEIFEKWAGRISGIVFLLAGVYYCLSHLFHLI